MKKTVYVPQTITKNEYTVTLVSPDCAIVSGGIFKQPRTVKKLLGDGDDNPKTALNLVPTMGLSLLPHNALGLGNLCAFATVCIKPCLVHQGQGSMDNVYGPRAAKTVLWFLARDWFIAKLNSEAGKFRAKHAGIVGIRLNMFSDIPWEHYGIIENHPQIQWYDYSKNPRRFGDIRPNYNITYSYDGVEKNLVHARNVLANGGNVSVVFYDHEKTGGLCGRAAHDQLLPKTWNGFEVVDGGKTDWRPDDKRGTVVGLRLLAKTRTSRLEAIENGFAQSFERANGVLEVA